MRSLCFGFGCAYVNTQHNQINDHLYRLYLMCQFIIKTFSTFPYILFLHCVRLKNILFIPAQLLY